MGEAWLNYFKGEFFEVNKYNYKIIIKMQILKIFKLKLILLGLKES